MLIFGPIIEMGVVIKKMQKSCIRTPFWAQKAPTMILGLTLNRHAQKTAQLGMCSKKEEKLVQVWGVLILPYLFKGGGGLLCPKIGLIIGE